MNTGRYPIRLCRKTGPLITMLAALAVLVQCCGMLGGGVRSRAGAMFGTGTPRSGNRITSEAPRWRLIEGRRYRLETPYGEWLDYPRAFHLGMLLNVDVGVTDAGVTVTAGGTDLAIEVRTGLVGENRQACWFDDKVGAVVTIDVARLRHSVPNAIWVTYEPGRYITLFINGELVEFTAVEGRMPSGEHGVFLEWGRPEQVLEMVAGNYLPTFAERYRTHMEWRGMYGGVTRLYPVFQYYNPILGRSDGSLRDPSEILRVGDRYYVYFTSVDGVDGFTGSVWCSSCPVTADPSDPESWSEPVEVVPKGDPETDHDGTGCFTPDCWYDNGRVYIFYTGLNSTHPRGFPQWNGVREPEHIMVAWSDRPDGGFVKSPKYTPLTPRTRALGRDEATVPGGHETLDGEPLYDVSLIDHGQCWVMPDGERRYYYKGGGGAEKRPGAVCLVRRLDGNWLNGWRQGPEPIIDDRNHIEGILVTRVDDTLFMQFQRFDDAGERLWETWTSRAADGVTWFPVGGGHRPLPGSTYPLSIGVYRTVEPEWAIGQFYGEGGFIELAWMVVL